MGELIPLTQQSLPPLAGISDSVNKHLFLRRATELSGSLCSERHRQI